jgi:hypothetical protein
MSFWLGEPVARGLNAMREMIIPPKIESPREFHNFEFIALWNTYAAIANSISLARHGGAVVIVPSGERPLSKHVKIKYAHYCSVLHSTFISFINARHRFGDIVERRDRDETVSDHEFSHAEFRPPDLRRV